MNASPPALDRCVGEAAPFVENAWSRRVHLHRGENYADLLSLRHVDDLLSGSALRLPAFRLVKADATLPASAYTRSARMGSRTITDLIDARRVHEAFDDGATIVLQGVHRYWSPVTAFCRDLEAELTHPVQANAYITPPVSQGLRVHSDAHDVFALQTHGHKQWVLYEDGPEADPTLDVALAPGDCLYVPRGRPHAARTVDDTSIHLTIGVRAVTWADALRPALTAALAADDLAESLPVGFGARPDALTEQIAKRLRLLVDSIADADPADLGQAAAERFAKGRATDLDGQLAQLVSLADLDDTSHVALRPRVEPRLKIEGDRLHIEWADRSLRLPAAAEQTVQRLLGADACRLGDLADLLDASSRVLLVRRLVREGLLVVVGE